MLISALFLYFHCLFAGSLVVPLVVALYFNEEVFIWLFLLLVVVFICGLIFLAIKEEKAPINYSRLIFTIFLTFVSFSILASLPFYLAGIDLLSSYLQSLSLLTTTGLSIVPPEAFLSLGDTYIFWFAFLQWFGAVFVVISVIVYQAGYMQKFMFLYWSLPDSGLSRDCKTLLKTMLSFWRIGVIFVGLTASCYLYLVWSGMSSFNALYYAFLSISTGGDGLHAINGTSGIYGMSILIALGVFVILASMNFTLHWKSLSNFWAKPLGFFHYYFQDAENRQMLQFLTLGVILLGGFSYVHGYSWQDFTHAAPLLVSLVTTSNVLYISGIGENLLLSSSFFIYVGVLLSFIGGSIISATGGIKYARYLVLSNYIKNEIVRVPDLEDMSANKYMGQVVPKEILVFSLIILFVYILGISFLSLIFSASGIAFYESLLLSLSVLTNSSIMIDIIGVDIYQLSLTAKIGVGLGMFLGRLEIFLVFYSLFLYSMELRGK